MNKMTRDDAVDKIKEYADEAENGNYHDLCAALGALADFVAIDFSTRYVIIKSIDEFPAYNNLVVLEIE